MASSQICPIRVTGAEASEERGRSDKFLIDGVAQETVPAPTPRCLLCHPHACHRWACSSSMFGLGEPPPPLFPGRWI
jgi:hypothetical protein